MRVLQLVPALHRGDAIGNNALFLKRYFSKIGLDSKILCIDADAEMWSAAESYHKFDGWNTAETTVILHYALPSVLNDLFTSARGRRILVYHNITPTEYLRGYPHLQHISRAGRVALEAMRDIPDVSVGDSGFNRAELEAMGFKNTTVIPIYIDYSTYDIPVNPVLKRMFGDDFVNILFVGRITPNKCQHDLVRLYAFFKHIVNEKCRLFLVGKYTGFEKYYTQIQQLASRLCVPDIYLTGRVDHDDLVSYYRLADVFISMSEHEGFCVPLLESMYFDVPVLAYKSAAVPDTLGGAGVLFPRKSNWLEIAEMAQLLVWDKAFRAAVIRKQRERLRHFEPEKIAEKWERLIGIHR